MKVHFQIFGDILLFVGWLAPAYGKDEVNSNGISPWQGWGWTKSIPTGSQRLSQSQWNHPNLPLTYFTLSTYSDKDKQK